MRKYSDGDERAIRVERLVREWTRSGFLEENQQRRILPELKVDLRRTNVFFRLVLFGFGILIVLSAVLLVGETSKLRNDTSIAFLFFVSAAASYGLGEFLITQYRLYRFGIEEAFLAVAGLFVVLGAGTLASTWHLARPGESSILVGLIAGTAAAFAIYLRFGHVYVALASMLCMTAAPFQMDLPREFQRLASAVLLLVVFIVARRKRLQASPDFPADEYSVIQAVAWAGMYACLNLHLSSLWPSIRSIRATVMTGDFQSFTFAAIWFLPGIGLFLALRDRNRLLLDVSIILSLVTLATNKPYLGMVRQTWDPILLGVFLIGTAAAVRRWLSARDRNGFTAERILIADKRGLAVLGTASAALHTLPPMPADATTPPKAAPPPKFEPGGGRSGGAGASGTF